MTPAHALVLSLAKRWLSDVLPPAIKQELAADFSMAEDVLATDPAASAWLENTRLQQHWEEILEDPPADSALADALRQALFEGRQVEVDYRKQGATQRARLHPFGWTQRNGVQYLACTFWNFGNPRWLAVHRVQAVTPLDAPARPPLTPEQRAAFLDRSPVPATAAHGAVIALDVEFQSALYEAIRERPPRGTQQIDAPADGWFRLRAEVPDTLGLRWWLLGFNAQVRILQPESLKRELQGLLFDRLTGLVNRHECERVLQRRLAETRRTHQPLSLVLLDLDHFKQVNDGFGHDFGDRALKHVAQCLGRTCRAMDLAVRYGGEEFLVLLPNTSGADAVVIAERLRGTLERTPLTLTPEAIEHNAQLGSDRPSEVRLKREGDVLYLTASLGVASETGQSDGALDELAKQVLDRVDAALYRAKHAGRNRVCVDPA
ncbi:diguanylate cyclase [Allochromatium palmeri]|uniref:diguanylate cyclase n=1 Tax=Allochromatium palmeri TaxID=231048 RepID=A0A6N8EJY0_9GAMM|nr:diguanylate cyclase [Allochromatium palmeri]MTW22827.1 diguanylate cyclase [Allochromatium palmeri]